MHLSAQKTPWVIDGALIDADLNVSSSVDILLVSAVWEANIQNKRPVMEEYPKNKGRIGSTIKSMGTNLFYFHFGNKAYCINPNIILRPTPIITSH